MSSSPTNESEVENRPENNLVETIENPSETLANDEQFVNNEEPANNMENPSPTSYHMDANELRRRGVSNLREDLRPSSNRSNFRNFFRYFQQPAPPSNGSTSAGSSQQANSGNQSDQPQPTTAPETATTPETANGTFECNICLDTASDPVVSMCGHLYW